LMLPLTFGIGIGSMLTGRLVSMTGRTTIVPTFGLSFAVVVLLTMALFAARLTTTELAGILLLIGLCLGTTMAVVQVTVQNASGPSMLGAGAASVQYSRSLGAAFGTAVVAAILFTVLSVMDPQTAAMFRSLVEQGASAISGVEAGHRAVMRAEIAAAFRAAFLTIAGFVALGLICALSIPTKRI
jgi:MFS family permease